ncbi:MAG: HAD-IIA family hydrolase [Oligoflexia bacterium]|nr:HAD-IIA family hydrolase [Oligoflexia bacterium]
MNTNMNNTNNIHCKNLVDKYDVILLDAFGVLVNNFGAIPGAKEFLQLLHSKNKPYYILTNGASKLPSTMSKFFKSRGLDINEEKIITSGSIIANYFKQNNLVAKNTIVLGTDDSNAYLKLAGANIVPITPPSTDHTTDFESIIPNSFSWSDIEVLALCDECGYPFLSYVDQVLSIIIQKIEHNQKIELILANPDLYYPKGLDNYGITTGVMAKIFENTIYERYLNNPISSDIDIKNIPKFVNVGKPSSMIFEQAYQLSKTKNMLMIGDQLNTDILGANNFGIDSLFVGTGVGDIRPLLSSSLSSSHSQYPTPTYIKKDLLS